VTVRRDLEADRVVRDTRDLYGGRTSAAALKASAIWNRLIRGLAKAAEDAARERQEGGKDMSARIVLAGLLLAGLGSGCVTPPSEFFAADLWLNRAHVLRCQAPTVPEVQRCLEKWTEAAKGTPR